MVQTIAPVMLSEGAKIASKVGVKVILTTGSSIGSYVAADKLVNEKYKEDVKSGNYTEEEIKEKRSNAIVKTAVIAGVFAGASTLAYLLITKKI